MIVHPQHTLLQMGEFYPQSGRELHQRLTQVILKIVYALLLSRY